MSSSGRVVFLGGVGEVGRNMACLELDDRILVIDCGLSFPHSEMPGIDLVLPDFQYLRRDPTALAQAAGKPTSAPQEDRGWIPSPGHPWKCTGHLQPP